MPYSHIMHDFSTLPLMDGLLKPTIMPSVDMHQNNHKASWSFVQWLYIEKTERYETVELMKASKKGNKFGSSTFCESPMRNLIQKHWVYIL